MKGQSKALLTRIMLTMLCLFFVGVIFSPLPVVEANSKTATLKDIKGEVYIKKGGGKREVKASNNMGVAEGDTIRTGTKAYVKVVFDKTTSASLGEKTTITVSKLAEKNGVNTMKVKQTSGKVWNKVSQTAGVKNTYQVETPTSIMGVRGTMFVVEYNGNGSNLSVFDGIVAARNPSSNSREQPVNPYEHRDVNEKITSMRDADIQHMGQTLDTPLLLDIVEDLISQSEESQRQSVENMNQFNELHSNESLIRAAELAQKAENLILVSERILQTIPSGKEAELAQLLREIGKSKEQINQQISQQKNKIEQTQKKVDEAAKQTGAMDQQLKDRREALRKQIEQIVQQPSPTTPPPPTTGGGGGGATPVNPPTATGTVTGKVYEVCPAMECPNYRADSVEGAIVTIKMGGGIVKEAVTDEEGSFEIRGVEANKPFVVEASFYSPFAGAITIASAQQQLEANGTITVELIFNVDEYEESTGTVTGQVLGCPLLVCHYGYPHLSQSKPIAAYVYVLDERGHPVGFGESDPDDGSFTIEVPVGTGYRISAMYEDRMYENYIDISEAEVDTIPLFWMDGDWIDWLAQNEWFGLSAWLADTNSGLSRPDFYEWIGEATPYTFDVEENEEVNLHYFHIQPNRVQEMYLQVEDKTSDSITVSWDSLVDGQQQELPTFYECYLNNQKVCDNLTDKTFTFDSLTPNTTYTIKIIAKNDSTNPNERFLMGVGKTEETTKVATGKVDGKVWGVYGGNPIEAAGATVKIIMDGSTVREATTDSYGEFEFDDVPANKEFIVEATFYSSDAGQYVTASSELQQLEEAYYDVRYLELYSPEYATLTGKVSVCSAQDPLNCLPQESVSINVTKGGYVVKSGFTDSDGSYSVKVPAREGYGIYATFNYEEYENYLIDTNGTIKTIDRRFQGQYLGSAEYTFDVVEGEVKQLEDFLIIPECGQLLQCGVIEGLQDTFVASDSIKVEWNPYTIPDFDHYRLYINGVEEDRVNSNDPNDTTFTFTNLEQDTMYHIKITAWSTNGDSPVAVAVMNVKTATVVGP